MLVVAATDRRSATSEPAHHDPGELTDAPAPTNAAVSRRLSGSAVARLAAIRPKAALPQAKGATLNANPTANNTPRSRPLLALPIVSMVINRMEESRCL